MKFATMLGRMPSSSNVINFYENIKIQATLTVVVGPSQKKLKLQLEITKNAISRAEKNSLTLAVASNNNKYVNYLTFVTCVATSQQNEKCQKPKTLNTLKMLLNS